MSRTSRRLFLTALVLLSGAGTSAFAQVKLEYKFAEGTKSARRTTSKTHQILTIMGMDVETESEESVVTTSAVGKRNADGTLPVEQKIESLRVQLALPGGLNVSYDSTDPNNTKIENEAIAFLGDVFKALVGVTYTVVLDDHNKVKFVQGTEAFDAKLEGMKPQAASALRGRLSADRIKKAFEQHYANLPSVLAREGEPWETTEVSDIGGGQTLSFRKRYEYLGTVQRDGKSLDKIGVRSTAVTYEMDPNADSPAKASKADLKIDKSEGTLLFDRDAGQMVEGQELTRIKGSLTLTIGGNDLPTTLDLTLDTKHQRDKAEK